MVIALEGLPGAGKTTSAYLLARRLGAAAVCETTHDHPFRESIYDDAGRYDLQVELAFLLLHHAGYREIRRDAQVLTDYSPVKDLLFAELMLSGADLGLFGEVYQHLYRDYPPPECVVYLDASPQLCLNRVRERFAADPARSFEAGLDVDRLRRIQAIYESRLADLGEEVLRVQVDERQSEAQVVDAMIDALRDRLSPAT